jgi:hypothetical protein
MMKLGTVISAVVWLGCWTIPVITGSPVRNVEMERAFGLPISKDELTCTPVFGKSGTTLFLTFYLCCVNVDDGRLLESDTPTSEGNDIIELPNKNAYVNQKWPNPKAIPYVIDSAIGIITSLLCLI